MDKKDISLKIKKIIKNSYNFDENQLLIYNYVLKGYTSKKISELIQKSSGYVSKIISEIKQITGLTTEDIRFLQYKNKKEIDKLNMNEIEYKRKIGEFIAPRYLGFSNTKDFPSFMYIKLAQLAKKYSYEIIYKTLMKCIPNLDYGFQYKKFNGLEHKLNYILIIIKSKIDDVSLDLKNKKDLNLKNQEKDDTELLESLNIVVKKENKTKKKDFSEFLDIE